MREVATGDIVHHKEAGQCHKAIITKMLSHHRIRVVSYALPLPEVQEIDYDELFKREGTWHFEGQDCVSGLRGSDHQ